MVSETWIARQHEAQLVFKGSMWFVHFMVKP